MAINPATGIAVVANKGSNDISLINLTTATPTFIGNICTAAVGALPPCPSSGPTSVSVDYVRNLALVVNSTSKSIAVVDLNAQAVTSVNPIPLELQASRTPRLQLPSTRSLAARWCPCSRQITESWWTR